MYMSYDCNFLFRSTVLSRVRGTSIGNPEEYDPLFMPQNLMMGVHTSTCGHVMHADCWDRFDFNYWSY